MEVNPPFSFLCLYPKANNLKYLLKGFKLMLPLDVEIRTHPLGSPAVAWIRRGSKFNLKQVINLGCNMDGMNEIFKKDPCRLISFYKKYSTIEELYEVEIERLLIHEFLHLILDEIWEEGTKYELDNIDRDNEISGYGSIY